MAPVYRDIEIEWEGETYTLTPTYRVIQRVEQHVSLMALLNRVLSGDPPISHLSELLSQVLRAAGCKAESATAENINASFYDADATGRLVEAGTAVLLALLPQKTKPEGNDGAPKGASPKSSNGGSTTTSLLGSSGSSQANSGG